MSEPNATWSPDHPLALGFTVLDDVPHAGGSPPHPFTPLFGERLSWWAETHASFLKANTATKVANTLFSGPLHDFRLSVSLTEAPRQDARSQWRIHLSTEPVFTRLADWQ